MARLFDDASSQSLGFAAALVTAAPLSMACWAYQDDDAANCVLMGMGRSGTANHYFTLEADGGVVGNPVEAVARGTTRVAALSSTGFSVNTWFHAAGVWASATDRRAFINGGSKGTNATTQTPGSLNVTNIGAVNSGGTLAAFQSGRIAEAAIWSVALTDEEVAVLALGYSPLFVRPASLVAYWPLIGRNSPENDRVGDFPLTLTNTPLYADHPRIIQARSGWRLGVPTAAAPGGSLILPLSGLIRTPQSMSIMPVRSIIAGG